MLLIMPVYMEMAVFSLNVIVAQQVRDHSWDSKAKNMHHRHTFLEGGGGGKRGDSRARDMVLTSLENLGAKFSETSFPHLRPVFCKSVIVTFRQ